MSELNLDKIEEQARAKLAVGWDFLVLALVAEIRRLRSELDRK